MSESLVFPRHSRDARNSWLSATKHCRCWWLKTVVWLVRWLMCNYCHRGGYVTVGVRLRFFVCYLHRGGYVTAGVRLLVCLCDCWQINSKSLEEILMEFSGNAANGLRKSDLNLGDVLGTESDIWSTKDQSRGAFIIKKPYSSCYTTAVCLNMWINYLLSGGLRSLVFLF